MIKYEIVTYFLSTDKWVKTDWFANDGIAHVKILFDIILSDCNL